MTHQPIAWIIRHPETGETTITQDRELAAIMEDSGKLTVVPLWGSVSGPANAKDRRIEALEEALNDAANALRRSGDTAAMARARSVLGWEN